MTKDHAAPCPPEPPPTGDRPFLHPLGKAGEPVRIFAFGGGGFDTAMQLGVVHALLVTRGAPPDMVIGCSAGAVNGVALAEVFQAEPPDPAADDAARERARVARFRQIFDGYLQAPGRMASALRPDTFQVDTQRPLTPIELPIHQQAERDDRLDALQSRAGLINLYNTLLTLRITMGTATRAIRRWLGIRAAGGVEGWRRPLTYAIEGFRMWTLVGQNLLRAASVVRVLAAARLATGPREEPGATAGELVFRWRWLRRMAVGLLTALTAVILLTLWAVVSGLVVGIGAGLGLAVVRPLHAALSETTTLGSPVAAWEWLASAGLLVLAATLVGTGFARERWLRSLAASLTAIGVFLGLLAYAGSMLAVGSAVLAALLDLPIALASGDFGSWPWLRRWVWDWVGAGCAVTGVGVALALLMLRDERRMGESLLAHHGIAKSVFAAHPVREFLVDLFDPTYYDPRAMEPVVEEALGTQPSPGTARRPAGAPPAERTHPKKLLEDYAAPGRTPPIHVAVTVADVSDGEFSVLPGIWTVVDGLMAAIAAPPILPPPPSADGVLVDGTIVANEPTRPLFRYLRNARQPDRTPLLEAQASELHVYMVAGLPFLAPELGPTDPDRPDAPYTSLVDIVMRALALQSFRDATLERRLTELNTRAMAPGTVAYPPPPPNALPDDLAFEDDPLRELFRSRVFAIEPQRPLRVNAELLRAEHDDDRRRLVAQAVADGCRAGMESMIQEEIREVAADVEGSLSVPCAAAVIGITGKLMAGSAGGQAGPGLPEVCRHCRLLDPSARRRGAERNLRVLLRDEEEPPPWPRDDASGVSEAAEADEQPEPVVRVPAAGQRPSGGLARVHRWPRGGYDKPTVSLLFSGGVFRGVFQMGVLNALSELHLRPDVIAGASVGSITAAMVARTFAEPSFHEEGKPLHHRRRRILWLAATYLGIDRLILTDRFADFVRTLTVRAAGAQVSIRDVDRVLRRFDEANPWAFSRELRRVTAGVERLAYVSPYELNDLVEAFRRQEHRRTMLLLRRYAQEWLDRMGVRNEVLGAEPLARLIRDHVLCGMGEGDDTPLHAFLPHGICFLATATNITRGRLEVLGENQLDEDAPRKRLMETLLASSAFPGVFRPRWSWEVEPTTAEQAQYIDGGVMDNLPVDAVAQFLHRSARRGTITARPDVPHLVFCASLEPNLAVLAGGTALERVRSYWPGLLKRARQLGYNQKLAVFQRTQRNIRAIFAQRAAAGIASPPAGHPAATVLSLEVISVIPNWLCGTFAFHPMLGFRRSDQAASIAHGCASTLLRLGTLAARRPAAAEAWGIRIESAEADGVARAAETFTPIGDGQGGTCWFRPKTLCPFSRDGQRTADIEVHDDTAGALAEIHRACGRTATHRPR
ncbi:MAG TPA: patatin-like phospholipase family protein [Gemmatimonadales bacterium]